MVQLFNVYAPNGDMFEVLPAKARELVINHGWSLEPPKAEVASLAPAKATKARATPVPDEVGANDEQPTETIAGV